MNFRTLVAASFLMLPAAGLSDSPDANSERDILVTFDNRGASAASAGASSPYHNRKRYAVSAEVKRHSRAVANEYDLTELDHWPIRSLSVYCFVYRVADTVDRYELIDQLEADARVESVQILNEFETSSSSPIVYDDTYANLQHGLQTMGIASVHQYTRGRGVRIAIIDSRADTQHEDLRGQIRETANFAGSGRQADVEHGTAVASVIAAHANNSKGIVGVAPESSLDVIVSCWTDRQSDNAVCDSFTLAKALDAAIHSPPDVLNMSLIGPHDPLLARLIDSLAATGVIVVAAASDDDSKKFPANLELVIGVSNSNAQAKESADTAARSGSVRNIYAPGNQIMVALPDDAYDFRSGTSIAAAHVTGVVALLLSMSPDMTAQAIREALLESQMSSNGHASINACHALQIVYAEAGCQTDIFAGSE